MTVAPKLNCSREQLGRLVQLAGRISTFNPLPLASKTSMPSAFAVTSDERVASGAGAGGGAFFGLVFDVETEGSGIELNSVNVTRWREPGAMR